MLGLFAGFALYDGQRPHPRHCHLLAPGALNFTAYNSSPKFCPNDNISKDLLLSIAAWKRLGDQFCMSFPKKEHFVLPQCVSNVRTHTHLRAHRISLPFSFTISTTHTATLCIQAATYSSCSVSIWAAFHCAVVTLSFHTTLTTQ